MTTPNIKDIVNTAYHAAVVSALVIGFSRIGKLIFPRASTPKLDFDGADIMMVTLDIGLALTAKDILEKQGILPPDIMK